MVLVDMGITRVKDFVKNKELCIQDVSKMLGQTSRVNSSHKRSSYRHMSENECSLSLIEILHSTRCTSAATYNWHNTFALPVPNFRTHGF